MNAKGNIIRVIFVLLTSALFCGWLSTVSKEDWWHIYGGALFGFAYSVIYDLLFHKVEFKDKYKP